MKQIILYPVAVLLFWGCASGNIGVQTSTKKSGKSKLDVEMEMEGNYVNGEKEGEWVGYYENGTLRAKGNWVDGKQEGKSVMYYTNGEVWAEGNYVDGKKEAESVMYRSTGEPYDVDTYKDGVCVEECEGDE